MEPSPEVVKAGFSKDLADCDQRIQDAFPLVRADFIKLHPDLDLKIDYTYRSPALQFELFKKGRTLDQISGQWVLTDRAQRVTDKDGVNSKGEHNFYPSKAADIYIRRGINILWPLPKDNPEYTDRNALYEELGRLWERRDVTSGATWRFAWKDPPHVQVA